jgi:hypothetical protein
LSEFGMPREGAFKRVARSRRNLYLRPVFISQ